MQITKGRLKKIIKEEMELLSESGDITMISESEIQAFKIILNKLTESQLKEFGIKKIS